MGSEARLLEIILGAGLVVKAVLAVLLVFSIVSWAIIVHKVLLLRRIEKETSAFYDIFWEKRHFSHILNAAKGFTSTPLARLFTAVYNELSQTAKSEGAKETQVQQDDMDRLDRVLKKARSIESSKLEYAVGFLATTGNTAPFIGLFGTVWGIMEAFRAIGAKGAANLAVVAPGIAEALIATAMGLLAAIPAVVGYNHIITKLNRINTEMGSFSSDLMNIIERQAGRK